MSEEPSARPDVGTGCSGGMGHGGLHAGGGERHDDDDNRAGARACRLRGVGASLCGRRGNSTLRTQRVGMLSVVRLSASNV